jgi:Protein of unknown function (DUF2917)
MIEAVLNQGRDTTARDGRANSEASAGIAEFIRADKLSAGAPMAGEGLIGRAMRVAASLGRRNTQTTFVGGSHQLREGVVERAHLPMGGRIYCQTGKVWITADGGGEDVVLSRGEFRWFRAGAWLLIEALTKAEIIVEA